MILAFESRICGPSAFWSRDGYGKIKQESHTALYLPSFVFLSFFF